MRRFLYILLLLCAPVCCEASGYAIYELNAAANGMANAYICRVNDASAIWYNPAALTKLEGTQVSLTTTWANHSGDFTPLFDTGVLKQQARNSFPSNVFLSHQFSDDVFMGVGIYTPFGFRSEWPSGSIATFVNEKTELRTFYVTPSIGFKLSPNVSVGGGLDFVFADFTMDRNLRLVPPATNIISQQVDVTGSDSGFNLGALIQTNNNWQFAVTYKHKTDVNFDGDVVFANVPATLRDVFPDGGANITLPLPGQLMFGAATTYENFSFEGNLIWSRWADFEAIRLNFDQNTPPDSNILRSYENTWSFRLGGDYRWRDKYTFRLGYFHDQSPAPEKAVDPILPDGSRNGVSAGVGYRYGRWNFDAAYIAEFFDDRSSPVDNFSNRVAAGAYTNVRNFISIGFGYKF